MNIRKNVLRAVLAAIVSLAMTGTAMAEADLSVVTGGPRTRFGIRSANVGLGDTGSTRIKVSNLGTEDATDVKVTLDTSAWPADQVITGVSGCIPNPIAAGVARTNTNWFPCTVSAAQGIPAVQTPVAIKPDVAADPTATPPVVAVDNGKTVIISIKYGVAKKKSDVYARDADGNYLTNPDGSLQRIAGAWVCPAADLYAPVIASATTATAESVLGNNASTQAAAPHAIWADMQVDVTGPANISRGGGDYTYTLTVKNLGPCAASTDVAVDDSVATGFQLTAADGICTGIDGDFTADGSDYQYCDAGTLAVDGTATATKTYHLNGLASDLISSNQGTGIQITDGIGEYADPNASNNVSDVTYVLTKSMGCSTTGSGTSFLLLAVGLGFLFLKRRK